MEMSFELVEVVENGVGDHVATKMCGLGEFCEGGEMGEVGEVGQPSFPGLNV